MKRYIAVLAALIVVVIVVAACGANSPTAQPATETVAAVTPTEVAAAPTPAATEETQPSPEATEAAATPAPTEEAAYPTPNPNPTCVVAPIPTMPNIPPVTEEDWVRGPENAPVTLIEYADFQCPACAGVKPMIEALADPETGSVRHVYRHFPLTSIHDKALITGEAAEAAGAQGAFWEMYNLLYDRQADWSEKTVEEMPDILSGYAEELGLDVETFDEDIASKKYEDKMQQGYDEAVALGLGGTPSFIGNGVPYPTQQFGFSPQAFDLFVQLVQIKDMQFDEPPPQVIESGKQYQATIKTEKGDIVIDLFADQTPVTVNDFVFLAQQGWYDGTSFHRVVPGFVAQAGDPTGLGMAWPGYRCSDELNPDLSFDEPGIVGMANSGPDTNGSQFFITTSPQPTLNGMHTVFGKVVSGLDVVENLTPRDPQSAAADEPGDVIDSITIEEK